MSNYQDENINFTKTDFINMAMILCASCKDPFDSDHQIINANGEAFHTQCFV